MSKILQEIFKRFAYAPFFGELNGLRHIHLQGPLCWSFGDHQTEKPSVECASDGDGCSSSKKDPPSKDRPKSCSKPKKRNRRKKRNKSKTCVAESKKADEGESSSEKQTVDCASKRVPEGKTEGGLDPCGARELACGKKRKIGKTCVEPVVDCGRTAEHKNEPCSFTVPKTAPKETFTTIAPPCEPKPKVKRTCPRKEAECRYDERKPEEEKIKPAPVEAKVEVKVPSPKAGSAKVEAKGPSSKAGSTKGGEKPLCPKAAICEAKKRKEESTRKGACALPPVEEYDYSGATAEIPSPHIFKRLKEGSLRPEISKTGIYKNPEYFSYNMWSFYEAMIGIAKISTPQPSNKKFFKPPQ